MQQLKKNDIIPRRADKRARTFNRSQIGGDFQQQSLRVARFLADDAPSLRNVRSLPLS